MSMSNEHGFQLHKGERLTDDRQSAKCTNLDAHAFTLNHMTCSNREHRSNDAVLPVHGILSSQLTWIKFVSAFRYQAGACSQINNGITALNWN